ncbi:SURF1 family protein [Bradyrhizobium sp. AUGA SZCCT0051]|nr:SURF1 family protein [Bradyrhizobium sp. AUGA SZCCT0124]MBR1312009.1 SURF1 family protein [Bradyrhizobium sp. AUGA SZCCT0051]MBR1343739.1 SURF1 family protein [Bradyrhizobium sp. AUGA SZCCT0105]MBR1358280.1 SURF1 family protein [Bradyrhizobium sp. AUGA SZCCT0045]
MRSARPSLVLLTLGMLGVVLLSALGIWQIERRTWKLALIERVEQRMHAAPTAPPPPSSWPAVTAASDEYRRVTLRGTFLNADETLVQAVTTDGPGFWVLTPLQMADGTTVLVNRGFVPPDRRDPASRRDGVLRGVVSVTGLLRMSEPKGGFLRNNDPAAGRWYSRDVAAIAALHRLSQVAPFFIDADATPNPGGTPIGGLTIVRFPNNHLIYALTWFALAFMLAGALLRVISGRGRAGAPDPRWGSRRAAVRRLIGAARNLSRDTGPDARAHIGSA